MTWTTGAVDSQAAANPAAVGDKWVVITGGGNRCTGVWPDGLWADDYQVGQEAQGAISIRERYGSDHVSNSFTYDGPDPHAILQVAVPTPADGLNSDWRSERVGAVGASYDETDVVLDLPCQAGDTLAVLAFARNTTDLPTSPLGAPTHTDVVAGSSMAAWVLDPGNRPSVRVTVPAGRSGHYVAAVVLRLATLEGGTVGGSTRGTAAVIGTYDLTDPTPLAGGDRDRHYGRFGIRYWRFTPGATGVIRFDLLATNSNLPGYLDPLRIDVLPEGSRGSIGAVVYDDDGRDTVWYVEAGETYTVIVSSTSEAWAPYFTVQVRSGGILGGEEQQVPEVEVQGNVDTDMTTGNFGFIHSGSHTHPGRVRDAIVCAWQHARRRRGPLPADPFWVDTCPTLTLLNYSFGGETGHIGDSGVGTGKVGWRYRVDADEIFIAGGMDFTIYMPYGHMNPSTAPDGKYVDLLGNRYGEGWTEEELGDYVTVQDLYGDDVLFMRDPLIGEDLAPVVSMDLLAAVDDDAVLGGVGAGEPKWFFNQLETEPANTVNAHSQGGAVITRERWVPVNPDAEWFNAYCVNLELMTDAPPKITGNADIPLTAADYVVSGTWSGQYLRWRAYRQPRAFLLFRRPPPNSSEEDDVTRQWPRDDDLGFLGSGERLVPAPRFGRVTSGQE